MGQFEAGWEQWLNQLPSDQVADLVKVVKNKHKTNGQSSHDEEKEVLIARAPSSDLYVQNPPPYVDVYALHKIYDKLLYFSNLLIKAPKGVGKSLSALTWAKENNTPVVMVECSEDTKKTDLVGSFFMRGAETGFSLGAIPTAIDVANEVGTCLLLFEEINALTPQIQKTLNAILDFRKIVTVPQIGKTYRLKDGAKLAIIATMNPSAYGGTYDLNEDLKSRVEEIEINYPPFAEEKRILKAVCNSKFAGPKGEDITDTVLDLCIRFALETRQSATGYALSTRDLVRLVGTIEKIGMQDALQIVICKFEGEDRDVATKRLLSVFNGVKINKHWGATAGVKP